MINFHEIVASLSLLVPLVPASLYRPFSWNAVRRFGERRNLNSLNRWRLVV